MADTERVKLVFVTEYIEGCGARDDGSTDHRSEPSIVPDHGPQPRRPKRPPEAVYKRDRENTYRPADSLLIASLRDDGVDADDRRFSREREVARLLTKTAKEHAPRLSWRANGAIAEVIEREVLPNARWIANSLSPNRAARVLERFVEVLWDEIALNRKKVRNTKS